MSTKLASVALVVFTALTLTHAAFVDYRSGTTENQRGQDKSVSTGPMQYLQTRKFGVETMMSQTQGAGAWSGSTRSRWTESGLCCGVFELLTRMKGGKTRIALLKSLTQPKNKLQLAYDLDITWKAVDAHISKLLAYGLVSEILIVGTSRLYAITEKGRNALALVQDCARVELMNHQ
jgi:DNA-binding transcriptional ArsR family regulator